MSASPEASAAHIACVQGIPVVTILGRLDANTAPVFNSQTGSLHNEPWVRILLHLSAGTYLSGAGLHSMIKVIKHTASCEGRIGLLAVAEEIMELIDICSGRDMPLGWFAA
jgi:anti-anti-sigma factor